MDVSRNVNDSSKSKTAGSSEVYTRERTHSISERSCVCAVLNEASNCAQINGRGDIETRDIDLALRLLGM